MSQTLQNIKTAIPLLPSVLNESSQQLQSALYSIPPEALWHEIMDVLQYGLLIVDPDFRLLYANQKAHELCQLLPDSQEALPILPQLILEICNLLHKVSTKADGSGAKSLMLECLGQQQQMIRITARRLYQNAGRHTSFNCTVPILVLLENCHEKFEAACSIECQKYGLTDREAEVWSLLRQEYSYQQAADLLQVSINTIKTHTKNIHAKRHQYHQEQQTAWFS